MSTTAAPTSTASKDTSGVSVGSPPENAKTGSEGGAGKKNAASKENLQKNATNDKASQNVAGNTGSNASETATTTDKNATVDTSQKKGNPQTVSAGKPGENVSKDTTVMTNNVTSTEKVDESKATVKQGNDGSDDGIKVKDKDKKQGTQNNTSQEHGGSKTDEKEKNKDTITSSGDNADQTGGSNPKTSPKSMLYPVGGNGVEESSHFFAYLVATVVLVAVLYIAYHNKRKVLCLLPLFFIIHADVLLSQI